jgi:hypothetical protein
MIEVIAHLIYRLLELHSLPLIGLILSKVIIVINVHLQMHVTLFLGFLFLNNLQEIA